MRVFKTLFLAALASAAGGAARAATLETIHSFCDVRLCADGVNPVSGLTADLAGNLYGTTSNGNQGSASGGVFQLTPSGTHWKYSLIFTNCIRECTAFQGRPIVDVAGNLYLPTVTDGPNNAGTIVELPVRAGKKTRKAQVVFNFNGSVNGSSPSSGLTYAGAASGLPYDGVSPLYGVTSTGGSHNQGVLYQLVPDGGTWTETVLYNFCSQGGSQCTDGSRPVGLPVVDASANLFGVTSNGGSKKSGVIYEVGNSGGTWNETVLHNNCERHGCLDGYDAHGLIVDAAGNLFGVGTTGDRDRAGVIFKLVPDGTSSVYSVVYNFCSVKNCRDGAAPVGELAMDASGNLFGVTSQGGGNNIDVEHAGGGTVFEFDGTTLTTLYAFCAEADCKDGANPFSGPVLLSDGKLVGETHDGGRYDLGTAFEITP